LPAFAASAKLARFLLFPFAKTVTEANGREARSARTGRGGVFAVSCRKRI